MALAWLHMIVKWHIPLRLPSYTYILLALHLRLEAQNLVTEHSWEFSQRVHPGMEMRGFWRAWHHVSHACLGTSFKQELASIDKLAVQPFCTIFENVHVILGQLFSVSSLIAWLFGARACTCIRHVESTKKPRPKLLKMRDWTVDLEWRGHSRRSYKMVELQAYQCWPALP